MSFLKQSLAIILSLNN